MQMIEIQASELDYRSKEAFKVLRTNIEFSGSDIKVICVTSCTPGEGKSSVSFEAAKSFAENGKRVLFVDADLRKSVLKRRHKKGKVRFGLTNYLVNKASLEDTICRTNVRNLDLIFAGPVPPNPSELLNNTNFANLIKSAREDYDLVIVDTPPLGSVIDTAVVSKYCDGAMMVISSGIISRRFAQKVKDQLELANCRILGVVLNKVQMGKSSYYGKYYGKYYGNYYGQDKKK